MACSGSARHVHVFHGCERVRFSGPRQHRPAVACGLPARGGGGSALTARPPPPAGRWARWGGAGDPSGGRRRGRAPAVGGPAVAGPECRAGQGRALRQGLHISRFLDTFRKHILQCWSARRRLVMQRRRRPLLETTGSGGGPFRLVGQPLPGSCASSGCRRRHAAPRPPPHHRSRSRWRRRGNHC
jgi:hypothetical protein